MTPVTKWTIWQRRWSIIWWSVGITALVVLTLIFYPTIRNQTDQLNKSFNQIPQSAKALFTDTQDIFSPIGYLSSQLFYLMLPMLLSILAIGLGSSLIAREETEGTLELILSRPVSRGKVILSKSLAGVYIVAMVGAVALVVTVLMCKLVSMDVGLAGVAIASLYSAGLALLFGSLAFLIASLGRTGRLASIGVTALYALAGYIISSLASVVSWLRWPARFFPFHYYRAGDILAGNRSWWPLICYLLAASGLGILAWLAFRHRDIG